VKYPTFNNANATKTITLDNISVLFLYNQTKNQKCWGAHA